MPYIDEDFLGLIDQAFLDGQIDGETTLSAIAFYFSGQSTKRKN